MDLRATMLFVLASALACATAPETVPSQPARETVSELAAIYAGRPLPAADAEDPIPVPRWLRSYLRDHLKGLPTGGRPQYPRDALAIAQEVRRTGETMTVAELEARVAALEPMVAQVVEENRRRAQYPAEWEVPIPEGTKLAALRDQLDGEFNILPDRDLDDRSPLPIWFRVYLRRRYPDLPQQGEYQYPRHATRELSLMLSRPDAAWK